MGAEFFLAEAPLKEGLAVEAGVAWSWEGSKAWKSAGTSLSWLGMSDLGARLDCMRAARATPS